MVKSIVEILELIMSSRKTALGIKLTDTLLLRADKLME